MALAWVLREEKVTSVLIGASKTTQLDDAVGMLANRHFGTCLLYTSLNALLVKIDADNGFKTGVIEPGIGFCPGNLPACNIA